MATDHKKIKRSAYRRARRNRCVAKIGRYPGWRPCKRLGVIRLGAGKWCWQHARIVTKLILGLNAESKKGKG